MAARPAPSASQSATIGPRRLATGPEPTVAANSGFAVPTGVSLARRRVALCLLIRSKGGHVASVETPTELFVHKLGAAVTMEETILEMLEQLEDEASDPKLK